MSILEVKHLSHGFGERTIFEDVSFRLLKGEHIGLVGANGEGKSTFMSIVTGHLQPDEGKVEWSKYVTAGYLDQHTVLEAGMSVRDVLRTAFDELFKTEARINEIYMSMADDGADMDALMEEVGELQDRLESRDFYTLDAKIDEVARALGVMDFGMDSDVTELSGGQRTKVLLAKLLLEKPDILLLVVFMANWLMQDFLVLWQDIFICQKWKKKCTLNEIGMICCLPHSIRLC